MTETEMRIAIAEACGWTRIEKSPYDKIGHYGVRPGDSNPGFKFPIPDYLNDLNAMHEAEKTLRTWMQRTHAEHLANGQEGVRNTTWALMHATARQRAEAFLKTIGKWKD